MMGKEAIRLLKFFMRHPTAWHPVSRTDPKAMRALRTLEGHGLIQVRRRGKGMNPQASTLVGPQNDQ